MFALWEKRARPSAHRTAVGPGCAICQFPFSDVFLRRFVVFTGTFADNVKSLFSFLSSLVYSLSCVQLFWTPWTAAHQASLSFTIPQSLLKLMSIEPMTPSNHLILCHPPLPLRSIFPSIRIVSQSFSHQVDKVLELQLQYQSFQ